MSDKKTIRVMLDSDIHGYNQYISFAYDDRQVTVNLGQPNMASNIFALDADLAKTLLKFFDYVVSERMKQRQEIMDTWKNTHLEAPQGYQQSIQAKDRENKENPV